MRRLTITLFLLTLIFSCTNKNQPIKKISKSFSLEIKDSITINHPNLYFQDIQNKNILLYNFVNYDIGVFNIDKKNLSVFNKQGNLYDEYNYIYPGTLNFINDSIIGVGGIKGIKTYNHLGEFKKNILVDNEGTRAPLRNFKIKDSLLIAILAFQGNPSVRSFYSKKHNLILKKNLSTGVQTTFCNYPNASSDLSNGEYYYPYVYDFFSYLDGNKFSFINSNDSNIYEYDILTTKLLNHSKLELEKYNPIKIKFGKKTDADEQLINMYSSGTIRGYFKYNEREIVLYSEGIKKEIVVDFFKRNNSQYDRPETPFWIHISDNKRKIVNDIFVPSELGLLSTMITEDILLFRKPKNEKDELDGLTKFYYVKLVEK